MWSRETRRTLRHLAAAEGYLELGMPGHSLVELAAIDDAGEFTSSLHFLKGEALKAQERYADAVESLHKAAETLPIEFSQQAWLSLSECFRASGYSDLAAVAEMTAETIGKLVDRLISDGTLDVGPALARQTPARAR